MQIEKPTPPPGEIPLQIFREKIEYILAIHNRLESS
jgi:hypothetical protein